MAKKMTAPKMKPPKIMSVDDQLTDHLKQAEHHLIAAVKLFERKVHPDRRADYIDRLIKVQEAVTTLFREELVRIRGPIKIKVRK